MSASTKTILIVGATSGIGEAFAHKFHSMGKKVIATGRRQDRLDSLKKALPGLETYAMDNADLRSLPAHVETLVKRFPDINTVWINSGIQYASDFKDASSIDDSKITEEIVVNCTAPTILAHHFILHLLKCDSEANFMITGSGLGFVPLGMFPVYCPTKSFTHSFLVGLRQQLKGTNVNVWELVAPYVGSTGLNPEMQANPPPIMSKLTPMPMEDFIRDVFEILEKHDAKMIKEIAPGSAKGRVDAWRGSIGKALEQMGMGG